MSYTAKDFHREILIGAIEGGINYWAAVKASNYEEVTATIIDREERNRHRVNENTIRIGLDRVAGGSAKANRTLTGIAHNARIHLDPLDVDAELADVIVQAGIFGQIVYG